MSDLSKFDRSTPDHKSQTHKIVSATRTGSLPAKPY